MEISRADGRIATVTDNPGGSMQRLVRAFPIQPGREDEVRAFAREVAACAEVDEFYEGYGVSSSNWFLQELDGRAMVIVVTEVVAPRPFAESYAHSERRFDLWFKDTVRRLSGVDPEQDPLGPQAEEIFRWRGGRDALAGGAAPA